MDTGRRPLMAARPKSALTAAFCETSCAPHAIRYPGDSGKAASRYGLPKEITIIGRSGPTAAIKSAMSSDTETSPGPDLGGTYTLTITRSALLATASSES